MTDSTLDTALACLSLTDPTEPNSFHPDFSSPEADLILVSAE